MSEQLPEPPDEGHPIAAGLAALVGVALAVGLVLGLVVVAGSHLIGLGGDGGGDGSGAQPTLYVPRPEKTPTESGPDITLAPNGETPTQTMSPSESPTESETPRQQITLSAGATTVAPMARLDLTGVYPGGEGAILRVERFSAGSWQDFGVTASVSDETFATYVQTGVAGMNRFRVVDTDTGMTSNEVRVTVG